MRAPFLAVTFVALLAAGKVASHEFWIDPLAFAVSEGDRVEAHLRVGEEFAGAPYSYLPRNFTRFEILTGGALEPVEGRIGDLPALSRADLSEGLAVVAHETTAAFVTYTEWERFLGFAAHKDFADVEARHDARELPRTGFQESYTRHAKSLIAIGDGDGADRELGLETEIVALANPYTDDLSQGLPVQVYFRGATLADVQVELFARAPDGSVEITLHRTDASGIAHLPVLPGHVYLVDHVELEAIEPTEDNPAVWHSYWASLTFAVPG